MNRIKKFAAMALVALGMSTAALAQEDVNVPHNFFGVKGGAQATLTHYGLTDLITPQYGIQIGRYFNQFVGTRLDVTGYQNKGGFRADRYDFVSTDTPYKFNAATADLDLLVNLTNVFNPARTNRNFNWNVLAGFGVNYTWDNDEFNSAVNSFKYYVGPELCSDKHASFNGRLGTQLEYCLGKNFAINLELDANYKNDQYNLKFNDRNDWQIQAFVGLTYKLGRKAAKKAVAEPEPYVAPVVKEEPKPVVKEEPKPVVKEEPKPQPKPEVVVKQEPLKETIYYKIRLSDPSHSQDIIDKVAAWCNKYPTKTISVSGYADKGTGNPRVNKMYAEQRATKVANAIKAKGIAVDRIKVSSYGDTVQPFAENDLNRCVIIVGE